MLISYYANKKSSPRLPSWQPSLIFFNIPIESGSTIKPCTLKHFQVTYMLHKAGYWTNRNSTEYKESNLDPAIWRLNCTDIFTFTKSIIYSDVIMSAMASRLFAQLFVQAEIKENIKALHHWPLWGESTGARKISLKKGQQHWKCLHLMMSSWMTIHTYLVQEVYVKLLHGRPILGTVSDDQWHVLFEGFTYLSPTHVGYTVYRVYYLT